MTITSTLTRAGDVGAIIDRGQFASRGFRDGTIEGGLPSPLDQELAFHELNTDKFPLAQANDIEKVLTAVDAIRAGANTPDAVATALGLSDRQGAYYADAAGYLGLVDTVSGAEYKTYEATDMGVLLTDSDAATRADGMTKIIARIPEMSVLSEVGAEGLAERLSTTMSETTAGRRASTLVTWARSYERRDLSFVIGTEMHDAQERIVAAVERAQADREARARAAAEPEPEICTDCWMAKSVSGACGC
jgi:hypothetical protein